MTTTFENAKVGDRVFDYIFQKWGVVDNRCDKMHILYAHFAGLGIYTYFLDGKSYTGDAVPRLLWDKVPPIVAPSKPVEVPPVDTLVRVWNSCCPYRYRYSAGKVINGMLHCFDCGATSKTTDGKKAAWPHWEIVND